MRERLRFVWRILDPVIFVAGVLVHLVTKRTPAISFLSMRRLYVATDGRLNDAAARASALVRKPERVDVAEGALGRLNTAELELIASALERDGYHVFDAKLDGAVCDRIIEYTLSTPARLTPTPDGGPATAVYERGATPLAPRYEFDEQQALGTHDLQRLATDDSLLAVARAYLGCEPVNDLVAMWWSPPTGTAASSAAAQLFHFDMDRLKFLKFFVYLTDVDLEHGPHVYVRGSHPRKPKALRRDERISDDEMAGAYGADSIVELAGERGTVLAVDTRGFHKGKVPEAGDRLLFQVEYANSLFGMTYNTITVDDGWAPEARGQIERRPRVFSRFRRA